MKIKNSTPLLAIIFILTIIACNNNDTFFQYKTVPANGWDKDSIYTFDIVVQDTISTHNIYVNIRNRGEYPYQNLWLFVEKFSPDNAMVKDSIELYLADQRGKWLGSGLGSVLEMPVLYLQNVQFKHKGTYSFKIRHGMRDSILTGINDVGMRVEKVMQ